MPVPAPPSDHETTVPAVEVSSRPEDGADRPFLVWRFDSPWCAVSSAPVGGGWGPCSWILNVQVRPGYDRTDLDAHVASVATGAGLTPALGVGLLTAADVTAGFDATDDGVQVRASVGIRWPTWAAAPPAPPVPLDTTAPAPPAVGTINLVVLVPAAVAPAALVNLATTATEAKAQALVQAGVAGTGTASDAVVVACPVGPIDERGRFGGPRSSWGAATARSVHAAVTAGIGHSRGVMAAEDAGEAGR